ncbi:MAG: hypothetical protein IJL87_06255 [Clostridia bacterium]|nr:hypothetical protein [Clostridia bacterium]
MYAEYTSYLWDILKLRWLLLLGFFAFVAIAYAIKAHFDKDSKQELVKAGLIACSLICAFEIYWSAEIIADIKQQAFITEHVKYGHYNDSFRVLHKEYVYIENDSGKSKTLIEAPPDCPYGDYEGLVTYAKHSKIFLDFVPD